MWILLRFLSGQDHYTPTLPRYPSGVVDTFLMITLEMPIISVLKQDVAEDASALDTVSLIGNAGLLYDVANVGGNWVLLILALTFFSAVQKVLVRIFFFLPHSTTSLRSCFTIYMHYAVLFFS